MVDKQRNSLQFLRDPLAARHGRLGTFFRPVRDLAKFALKGRKGVPIPIRRPIDTPDVTLTG
ncbi:hypothetical protein OG226_00515 [Streptomyces sp. NBC_01261]|uniref:hypothetical protein n=1 Tax=Streptomyces sp. NBC_01261 TaxID=2903802 RepID=UPI002E36CCF8|nr:hypothetical protein [Streptomyces sp. NBC_01261]